MGHQKEAIVKAHTMMTALLVVYQHDASMTPNPRPTAVDAAAVFKLLQHFHGSTRGARSLK